MLLTCRLVLMRDNLCLFHSLILSYFLTIIHLLFVYFQPFFIRSTANVFSITLYYLTKFIILMIVLLTMPPDLPPFTILRSSYWLKYAFLKNHVLGQTRKFAFYQAFCGNKFRHCGSSAVKQVVVSKDNLLIIANIIIIYYYCIL